MMNTIKYIGDALNEGPEGLVRFLKYDKHSSVINRSISHYIFIISQLRLTSHPRSTVVLLDTETPGTSREIYSEDAEGEARTRNPWITNPVL